MIDFPASPTNGQEFTGGNNIYVYNGYGWTAKAAAGTPYLQKGGDTMTGPLTLFGDPSVPQHATDKQYVDAGNALKVAKVGDVMSGDLGINSLSPVVWLNKTAPTGGSQVIGQHDGVTRNALNLSDGVAGNFAVGRYNDAGALVDAPLLISRATGGVSHPLGTDWGFGPMRFKYIGANLVWDKDLNNVNRIIWDAVNNPAAGAANGYQKLASGIILQWGVAAPSGVNGEVIFAFPVAFPTACLNATATVIGGSQPATTTIVAHIVDKSSTNLHVQARFITGGGTVGAANQNFHWQAVGW